MKILDIKHIEDCFDGSVIQEILFTRPISKEFIFFLGKTGKLHYLDTFARPFFKVITENYEFKGVEGNHTIRIILKNKPEESLKAFRTLMSGYIAGQSD
jgi:hypothetical protein